MRLQVSLLAGLLASALAGCGDTAKMQPSGQVGVSVSASTYSGSITVVRLEAQPANVTRPLTYDAASATFTGSIMLPVGSQTLTARAYAGDQLAGQGTATVTIVAGQTANVVMRILDASAPAPLADVPPAILALTTSTTQPAVGEAVTLTVSADDANGDALSYEWSSDCTTTSSFSTTSAAQTVWTSAAAGVCRIGVTVTANGKSVAEQVDVTALETGSGVASIQGTYVRGPSLQDPSASTTTGFSCSVGPVGGPMCSKSASPGVPVTVRVHFSLGEPASSADVAAGTVRGSLTDDCGGAAGGPSVSMMGATAGYVTATWTPPSSPAVCVLTIGLEQETMIDKRYFVIVVK